MHSSPLPQVTTIRAPPFALNLCRLSHGHPPQHTYTYIHTHTYTRVGASLAWVLFPRRPGPSSRAHRARRAPAVASDLCLPHETHLCAGGEELAAWGCKGADGEADLGATRLPDSRQRARTVEEREEKVAVVAAAEGGRRRRRRCCCWCRSWWVAEVASARTRERARSRGRRAAQARAAGARASPREGWASSAPWAFSPPATSGRARAPHHSALPRRLAHSS